MDKIKERLLNNMDQACAYVAGIAGDKYAPKGWSLQLSRGIKPVRAKITGGIITAGVISQAKNDRGYNYAVRQHNEKLRHLKEPDMFEGYTEHGTGKTKRDRYRSGYLLLQEDSPKFATKYLTTAFGATKSDVLKILKSGL